MGAVVSWLLTALCILVLSVIGAACLTILFLVWLAKFIVKSAERFL